VPAIVVTLPAEAAHRHADVADLSTPARAMGSTVFETSDINAPETLAAIAAAEPDLCTVVGWSQICRAPLRSIARIGSVGFHPAALPRLRGRGVIPWTILLDEPYTGSTLFWLDEGVDSGDILLQRTFVLAPDETARSLYIKHTDNLAAMLPEAVALVSAGNPPRLVQDESLASYCAKRTPEDGLIDWSLPAASVLRLIRAVGDPYPGAYACAGAARIVIDAAAAFAGSHRFIGLAGQVQVHTEAGFVVRCGDGECIEVLAWRSPDGKRPRLHSKLTGV
jgi:methionyl-tRNA formyltransferase